MKDLDFDELDRAVSSLMTGIPKTAAPAPSDSGERILNLNSVSPEPATAATTELTPSVLDTTPDVTASPLVSRQGGRFMDMVRSSPGSRPASARPMPVSRQGATMNPTTPVITAEPILVTPPAATDLEEVTSNPSPVSDWPDPIDMQTKAPDATPVTTDSSNVTVTVESLHDDLLSESTTSIANEADDATASYTPFLTDSKVEKRPLGAFNDSTTESDLLDTPSSDTPALDAVGNEPLDAQLAADPLDTPIELPAELQKDVMAIEADQETTISSAEAETVTPVAAPVVNEVKPVRPVTLTGPGSIAQQYRTEPTTSDMTHAGIYDAETYKQPLAHPVKKKSGWLLVLWIVLLLALGSGGAAILYYLDII
jgi:hypothetical protein